MIKIESKDYDKYVQYFQCFSHVIAIEAILLGHSKGVLYVDHRESPELLVIWNQFDGFYVSLQSEEKIESCQQWIRELTTEAFDDNHEFVVYINEPYDDKIKALIPVDEFEPLNVLFYSTDDMVPYKTHEIVRPNRLLENLSTLTDYSGGDEISEVIESTWSSFAAFQRYGAYEIMVNDAHQEVVGYCISEHITEHAIEFSIEVNEKYRKQGMGESLGHRLLNTCRQESKRPCWYCTDDNKASMHLAEKLGLQLMKTFTVWFFQMD